MSRTKSIGPEWHDPDTEAAGSKYVGHREDEDGPPWLGSKSDVHELSWAGLLSAAKLLSQVESKASGAVPSRRNERDDAVALEWTMSRVSGGGLALPVPEVKEEKPIRTLARSVVSDSKCKKSVASSGSPSRAGLRSTSVASG